MKASSNTIRFKTYRTVVWPLWILLKKKDYFNKITNRVENYLLVYYVRSNTVTCKTLEHGNVKKELKLNFKYFKILTVEWKEFKKPFFLEETFWSRKHHTHQSISFISHRFINTETLYSLSQYMCPLCHRVSLAY